MQTTRRARVLDIGVACDTLVSTLVETLGRYQILDEIGRGGCGIVYRALDPGIGRTVAIKTIRADATSASGAALRERFRREARSAGILSHPHIVTIHEFNDSGDVMFIAMEFIDGLTLAAKMAGGAPLPLDFTLSVLRAAAEALDYAHANNIVHRDVKPANFMMTPSGQLKVTDFGIAKMLDEDINLTNTGMVIGTAQYMSPEQIAAKPATGRSDQFSLAVIAYEMLTGQKPFQGNSWASVMHQIMSSEPPPVKLHRKDLGDEVTTVLRKGLAKDPAARYPTCKEFAEELAEAVLGVTMQRTLPPHVTDALKKPLPPLQPEVLPETEVMPPATGPAVRAVPQPLKTRPVFAPMAMGAGAAILLAAGWFWFSLWKTHEKPGQPVAVPVTTPVTTGTQAQPPVTAPLTPGATTPTRTRQQSPPAPIGRKEITVPSAAITEAPAVPTAPVTLAPVPAPVAAPAPAPVAVVAPPVIGEKAPAATAIPAPTPVPTPAPTVPVPTAPVLTAPASTAPTAPISTAPVSTAPQARIAEAADARKMADGAAARKAVDEALNRYRTAFESKDSEALKSVWPGLGRAELSSIQNFFKIARTIRLQLLPVGEPEITADGASVRARRTLAATDERGPLPQQDQNVKITLRRSANTMVIESIEAANR